jgi:ATP adenylyltransferase
VLHEQLWAPWRLAYIKQDATPDPPPAYEYDFAPGADHDCFICRAAAARKADGSRPDRENLVAARTRQSLVILNRYPYNNGHLLVAPLAHKGRLDELAPAEAADLHDLLTISVSRLEKLMNAEGFNIGLNLGRVAGAGLPGHVHWHIVPRWSGDTNFMGVLAGVEVIPQALDALWQILAEEDGEHRGHV